MNANKYIPLVRSWMRTLGYAIQERATPEIRQSNNGRAYYQTREHVIYLPKGADEHTLVHELAHSQQNDLSTPAYAYLSGREHTQAWLSDYREREADAVADVITSRTQPWYEDLSAIVPAEEMPAWCSALRIAQQLNKYPTRPKYCGRRMRLSINNIARRHWLNA